jgi:UDP-glucuronate 4-epimerase
VLDRIAHPDPRWDSANPDPAYSPAPYRLYNIGSNRPIDLLRYIEVLENLLGRRAEKVMLPIQPGDVADTFADVRELQEDIGYRPTTPIEVGVRNFVEWFREYYREKIAAV